MDEDVDELLTPFDLTRVKVDVSVAAGEFHPVSFNATIQIDATDRPRAIQDLRSIVAIFRLALPLTEIRGGDEEYEDKRPPELAVDKDGNIKRQKPGQSESNKAFRKTREELKEDDEQLPAT